MNIVTKFYDPATLRQALADYKLIRERVALGTLRVELPCAYRELRERRLRRSVAESMNLESDAHDLARLLRIDPGELLALDDGDSDAALATIHDLAERLRRDRKGAA